MLAQSTCGVPVEHITKLSNDLIQLLKHPRGQAVPSKPADLELDQSIFKAQREFGSRAALRPERFLAGSGMSL